MLTTLIKWIAVAAFLVVLFRGSARDGAVLLFAAWTVAIAVFAYRNLLERFLWIPVVLALAGVFGSLFVLSFPNPASLLANETLLVMFIVSLDLLGENRRLPIPSVHHRSYPAFRG
jgi:hypothetical protein